MRGVEERSVSGARRCRQQRIAVGKAPAFPQPLRPEIHEPPRIVGRACQRNRGVGDEQRQRQRGEDSRGRFGMPAGDASGHDAVDSPGDECKAQRHDPENTQSRRFT